MSSTLSIDSSTALLIIDVQKGFRDESIWGGNRSTPDLEENIQILLAHFRQAHFPIIHVKHDSTTFTSPLYPSKPGNEIEDYTKPPLTNDEPILHKNVNSAFIGTDLEERLREMNVSSVVVAGLTTNHCCETTARMAANLGFNVFFVRDATATFDQQFEGTTTKANNVHINTLANLNEEFATIVTTNDLVQAIKQNE